MEILTYLLKVNVSLTVFYLVCRLCYRHDTFFALRRYVLLIVLIFSGIYPLLDILHWFSHNEVLKEAAAVFILYLPDFTITASEVAAKSFPVENIFLIIYAIITGFFLIRFVSRFVKIIGLRICCDPIRLNGQQVYRFRNQGSPFSFFNWIFFNPDNYKSAEIHQILTHELVHVRQLHSIDMLLSELTCVLCWFNPFARMLRNEVHRNLEFLVDNRVIRSDIDSRSYQLNLLRLANNPANLIIVNHFKQSPLKERIIMLNKKQTSKIKLATYSLLLPLAVMLIAINAVSCVNTNSGSQEYESVMPDIQGRQSLSLSPDSTFYTVVDAQPTFPGGDDERTLFIQQNLRYPIEAQKNGIQGRVTCSFIVQQSGEITDIEIFRGIDPSLDKETMRVIAAMPRWNPGKINGVAVPVKLMLPIAFRLR